MARLAAADLSAATNTALYTVPAATRAYLSVNLCNRSSTVDAVVRIALTTGGVPGNTDWIDYDMTLEAKASYERSGIILTAGQVLYVRSDVVNVNAVVWGVEERQ